MRNCFRLLRLLCCNFTSHLDYLQKEEKPRGLGESHMTGLRVWRLLASYFIISPHHHPTKSTLPGLYFSHPTKIDYTSVLLQSYVAGLHALWTGMDHSGSLMLGQDAREALPTRSARLVLTSRGFP